MTKLLLIEDEATLREIIAGNLAFEGFTVLEAGDGEEGLALIHAHHPDLVICDIAMPRLDGYELLRAVREDADTRSMPFIFLTASADRASARLAVELGADDYLTKPITLPELLLAIQYWLARHRPVMVVQDTRLKAVQATLAYLVSHELRTPLVSSMMIQDIIAAQVGQLAPARLDDLLDKLSTGSRSLARLVEQMAFLTGLEAGTLSPRMIQAEGQVWPLAEITAQAIDLGRRFADCNHEAAIQVQEPDRDTTVAVHLPAFRHALAELIANALSFSPGGGEVTITQWRDDGMVWLCVADQGNGLPPEQLEHVFDMFYQIDRDMHAQQGIGLGLPLARRITEAHGGTLTLISAVNQGTQVTVCLPVAHHQQTF
ncbi:MAG: hybrid sensor histidine kinase/response regulator [Chloroflexi bacterium]|nr:hybrid sensor histidine kinase/response regulator [Chloroflexota bacterium]